MYYMCIVYFQTSPLLHASAAIHPHEYLPPGCLYIAIAIVNESVSVFITSYKPSNDLVRYILQQEQYRERCILFLECLRSHTTRCRCVVFRGPQCLWTTTSPAFPLDAGRVLCGQLFQLCATTIGLLDVTVSENKG